MENKFNQKIFLTKSSKKIKLQFIRNFTLIDIIIIFSHLIIAIACFTFIPNHFISIPLGIILIISLSVLLTSKNGKKLYTYLKIFYLWKISYKKSSITNPLNMQIHHQSAKIFFSQKLYLAIFKINSINLDLLSDVDKQKVLDSFWNIIKNSYLSTSIIKIPSNFSFADYLAKFSNKSQKSLQENLIKNHHFAQIDNIFLILKSPDLKSLQSQITHLNYCNNNLITINQVDDISLFNLFCGDWNFHPTSFSDVNKNGFIYQIRDFSLEVNYFWLKELFNLENSFVWINLNEIPKIKAQKKLDNMLDKLEINMKYFTKSSQVNYSQNLFDSINYELENVVKDIDKFKNIEIFIGAVLPKTQNLIKVKNAIKQLCLKNNILYDNLIWQQNQIFISLLDHQFLDTANNFEMTSQTFATSFFLNNHLILDANGILLGYNQNHNPVIWDLFQLTSKRINHNLLVFGTSGSGKTTVSKKILEFYFHQKTNIFIIDPEDEFKDWVNQNHGVIFDLSGDQLKINPLEIFDINDNVIETINQKLLELEDFFLLLYPQISKNHLQYLINYCKTLLQNYFAKSQKSFPIFSDLYNLAFKDKQIFQQIHYYITPLVERYGKFWNGHTNIKITDQNNLYCASLKNLTFQANLTILGIQIILITKYLNKLIIANQNNHQKFIIAIDEAHVIAHDENPIVLQYLANLAKRVRKYHTSLILITQNLTDFTSATNNSKYFAAILNNSQYKLYGGLQPADITSLNDLLKNSGGLTAGQKEFLAFASQGKFILALDNNTFQEIQVIQ